MVNHN